MLYHRYLGELHGRVSDGADTGAVEAEVKADMRQHLLGGRVLSAMCGSAPLSAELRAFMESLLGTHLTDGYGSTEAGVVLADNRIQRPPVIDYKLVDVPELGYFLSDKPYPRGELLLKTGYMTPGYYQRPDVTAETFDADGFYRTGDIMAESGPDELRYVDRRNNVLKLAQGEFVTPAHLEAVFAGSALIRQIFVYGSSERSFLLAVVVPTAEVIAQLERDGVDRVKSVIGESLQQIAQANHLNGHEIPRDLVIETEPFTLENGLLTDAGKLARPKVKERYGERLEQTYAQIAAAQLDEFDALRTGTDDRPVLETVTRAVRAELGLSSSDVRPDARFGDLGGDSLSAWSFSELLHEIFGVEVPASVIGSPATDLRGLANYIETQRGSGATRPTFAAVHGSDSTEFHAGDLTLDKFIDAQTLKRAPTLPRPHAEIHTVLLTGATGYLGRFLALQWLERLSETSGTLICVVRAGDAAQARLRIEEALDTDPELIERFRALAADHLEVVAGDIGEPALGLDEATWNRLAERVDLIAHPAAQVNHVLPYDQLFGPNVVGTAELIRLAITTKVKPVNYISTVATAVAGDEVIDEDADMRVASPVRKVDGSYANGYAISKWASEVLVREAHDLCGLPVAVFRCDMILAHSRYAGQLNVPDMFTRLLLSLIATGIAPRSFYRPDGNSPRPHYDGLPVDVVAQAVAALGAQAMTGFHTYNVVNPHDDGISLDQFVDWLVDAEWPIQRIDDYDEWTSRFETAMRSLPDHQRQQSVLPVFEAYRHPAEAVPGSPFPSDRFQAGVHAIGRDIPHLSAALINKYTADLQKLRLL
jgi:fatty acid CoA ligase FadD9